MTKRQRHETTRAAGGFIRQVRLDPTTSTGRYPFTLPVVQHLRRAGGIGPRCIGDVSGGGQRHR